MPVILSALWVALAGPSIAPCQENPPQTGEADQKSQPPSQPASVERLKAEEPARTSTDEPSLMSLEEMLSIALEQHPDVRAAEAKLQAAEAELDRTRLVAVQKVIAFREKWQVQKSEWAAAHSELKRAEAAASQSRTESRVVQLAMAKEKFALARARLAQVEAELPFLLGRAPQRHAPTGQSSRQVMEQKLLPMGREVVQVLQEQHRTGRSDVYVLAEWMRRVGDLQRNVARTKEQRIAAIEAYRKRVQELAALADARYRTGTAGVIETRIIQYYLAEADLWLAEAKGD